MKKIFLFSFLVLGSTSLLAQMTIFRELIVSFYGNEFFVGVLLAVWVLWVAAGSFLVGLPANGLSRRLWQAGKFNFRGRLNLFYILTFILSGLFLGLEIILIRWLNNFGVIAGQLADLVPALLASLFLPAPLCFNLGAQFALAAKIFPAEKSNSQKVSQIYLWESLGFVVAGVLFNFWLVQLNPFLILFLVVLINLAAALILTHFLSPQMFWLKISCLILIASFLSLMFLAQSLDQKTLSWRFNKQQLLESFNSPYGQVAVTKIGTQYNFYESGLLLGPDKETQNNEYLAHLTLLQHAAPKNVLLIGGGFNGLIGEILKHPVQKLTYLELDWRLLDLAKIYASPEIKADLADKRVKILNLDGRYFIKNSSEKFDVILINLPSPTTALINRFYTKEFFEELVARLNSGGVFGTQLPFSPEYQNLQLTQLNSSIFKTLKTVFPQVLIFPEETNIFLAAPSQSLTYQPNILLARLQDRQIKTIFFTENYLRWRLTNERIGLALAAFEQDKTVTPNQDFKPSGYFYNLTYWLTYFHPGLGPILTKIFKLNFWWLLVLLLAGIFLPYVLKKRGRAETVLVLNMAIFGGLIMAGQIIFILLYQTIFGYLYQKLAVLFALLMAGLALGTWQGKKKTEMEPRGQARGTTQDGTVSRGAKPRTEGFLTAIHPRLKLWPSGAWAKNITACSIIKIQAALIVFMAFSFWFLAGGLPKNLFLAEWLFYLIIFLFGYLAGFGFPYLNSLYLKNKKGPNLGLLYSADLAGAAFGGLLPALILLPLFGLNQTIFLIGVTIVSGALLLFLAKNLGGKNI